MDSFLQDLQAVLPYVLLFLVAGFYTFYVRKALKAANSEWKEEEARKARIRALNPQPSYEERMGVSYGPTGSKGV
jgi:hypothetical protein